MLYNSNIDVKDFERSPQILSHWKRSVKDYKKNRGRDLFASL